MNLFKKLFKKGIGALIPTSDDIYVNRLVKEWIEHDRIILSIDFDSTISYWNTIENQEDIEKTIDLVRRVQGATYNVIFTACHSDRYNEIRFYCNKKGIRVDAINQNPIDLPYGKSGKIFYNWNLCDRSGLKEALIILETAYYMYRGHKQCEKVFLEMG